MKDDLTVRAAVAPMRAVARRRSGCISSCPIDAGRRRASPMAAGDEEPTPCRAAADRACDPARCAEGRCSPPAPRRSVHSVGPEHADDAFLAMVVAFTTSSIPTLTLLEGYADVAFVALRRPVSNGLRRSRDARASRVADTEQTRALERVLRAGRRSGQHRQSDGAQRAPHARRRTEIGVGTECRQPGNCARSEHVSRRWKRSSTAACGRAPSFRRPRWWRRKRWDASASWARRDGQTGQCRRVRRRSDRTLPTRDGYVGGTGWCVVRTCGVASSRSSGAPVPRITFRNSTVDCHDCFPPTSSCPARRAVTRCAERVATKPVTEGQPRRWWSSSRSTSCVPTTWIAFAAGGLGRLLRGGAVMDSAFQDHAVTETAPGHSVTMSGRYPASTGIREEQHRSGRSESAVDRCAW